MPTTTSSLCGLEYLPKNLTNISSGVYTAFATHAALNVLTSPLAIFLNILVMVAVKTKRQLRTKSNISLACLAATDFAVGLIVQPLSITNFSLMFIVGRLHCTVIDAFNKVNGICLGASLFHLLLLSGERYLAMKHPFAYENGLVTEARIIVASGLLWMCAAIVYGIKTSIFQEIHVFMISAIISTVVYFHVVVYREVRRNTKQIVGNQVSLADKEKLLKNRKAFNTTVVIVLTLFLCYIPVCVQKILVINSVGKDSFDLGYKIFLPSVFLLVLNSSLNPLIYTVRIRQFRVAFIQMLTRKTLSQAEELENKIFKANRMRMA